MTDDYDPQADNITIEIAAADRNAIARAIRADAGEWDHAATLLHDQFLKTSWHKRAERLRSLADQIYIEIEVKAPPPG
jgi:hypothetical protein